MAHATRSAFSSKTRVEFFSDGVFAIVITILVLELKAPEHHLESSRELWQFFVSSAPKLLSWIVGFLYIVIWWMVHHEFFELVEMGNRGLLWLNSLFLLWVCFLPFPTALMGEYPDDRLAALFFGTVTTLTCTSFVWMHWYACFSANLIKPKIPVAELRRRFRRAVTCLPLYLVACLTTVVSPQLARWLFAAIPLVYVLPIGRRH